MIWRQLIAFGSPVILAFVGCPATIPRGSARKAGGALPNGPLRPRAPVLLSNPVELNFEIETVSAHRSTRGRPWSKGRGFLSSRRPEVQKAKEQEDA